MFTELFIVRGPVGSSHSSQLKTAARTRHLSLRALVFSSWQPRLWWKGHQHHIVDEVSTTGQSENKRRQTGSSAVGPRLFSAFSLCTPPLPSSGHFCHSHRASARAVLNIWTLLIKSNLNSVLLRKVVKLLKGVTGKIVARRLRQERLIKWPLLLLTCSKSAFFHPRQASVRECGSFFPHSSRRVSTRYFFSYSVCWG